MTIEEVKALILENKNAKKYTIEDTDNGFTVTLGNFRLTVNKQIADNIETELPYKYLGIDREDRTAQIHDIEKDINVLLSRDWEPQTYSRAFHVFIGEPEENGKYYTCNEIILQKDYYDLITEIDVDGDFDVTNGGADADVVYMETICSLPIGTLNAINEIPARDAIDSDMYTYSSKYTDWYGKGFTKGKLDIRAFYQKWKENRAKRKK